MRKAFFIALTIAGMNASIVFLACELIATTNTERLIFLLAEIAATAAYFWTATHTGDF